MTTRTLINAVCVTTALFPAAFASAQPRPVPTPRPIPTPVEQDRPAIEAQPLAIGESVVGGLNDRDHATADGKRVDHYRVELTEGQPYHFSVVGQGFPVTVEVLQEDGSELLGTKSYTDDGLFIIYTAHTGVYTVAVSTENADDSGRYILHTVEGGEDLPERPNQTGDVAVRESTEPFTGTLNDQSEKSAQGRFFEYSVVELEAGTEYCLYAQSPDDGVFVDIVSIDNNPVEFLAIEQEGAYIRVTPTVTGPHALSTISKQPGHATSYTGYAWVPNTGSSQTIVDQLSAQSVKLDDGTYFDFHEVELVADTTYVIDVTSDAFDAVAYLFDADDNQLAVNDNAQGNTTDAQITFTPEAGGTYYVGVGTPTPDATGGYIARVASGDRIGQDSGVTITRGDDDMTEVEASPLLGHWELVSVASNGRTEQVPAGAATYAFDADGNMTSYTNGEVRDSSTYTVEGNRVSMTEDDGSVEVSTFQIQGDTMTVTFVEPQTSVGTVLVLKRVDAQPAARAQAPVGRWNLTSIAYNGETQQIPAGSIVVTVAADGTIHSQVEDQTDNGTYSVEGDQISIRYESDGVTNTSTFQVQGRTLTIQSDDGNGNPVTMTFNYLGEPGGN